jgi:glycosyltransferase involved in cell wall biosynthesis
LKNFNAVLKIINFYKQQYLKWLKYAYTNMIKNTTLVTNSKYSSKAIFDECGIRDTMVLSPPVDVEKFRKFVFLPYSSSRDEKVEEGDDYRDKSKHEDIDNCDKKIEKENIILVISRIDPTKKIEKAITLAHLLKNKGIGKGMVIVGNLDEYNHGYYISLKEMVEDLKLKDYVKFEIDAPFDKLLLNMKKSKVYFHPRSGEHFGMSIVEAMSAGLIPVVPDEGGQTEFVPSQYQYNTLEQASQIVSNALDIPISERLAISNSVQRFSVSKFKKNFQQIVKDKLLIAEKMH